MITLGIETSCDETAASVVRDLKMLSNVISSSVDLHAEYGGVVPEIASRYHVEYINFVIKKALSKAKCGFEDLDSVAVTSGPGLVGSLLVGISAAKAISLGLKIPIIGVNHVYAHLFASKMLNKDLDFPFIGLVVSGGHTSLFYVSGIEKFRLLGQTTDDAAGEAYDKVAKILELGYPGGPIIDKLACQGNPEYIRFPRAYLDGDSLDFSFSGIKTAVLYHVRDISHGRVRLRKKLLCDIAASFQEAVVEVLINKAVMACARHRVKRLVIGGGVSANSALREKAEGLFRLHGIRSFLPPVALCTDNAVMIAGLGQMLIKRGIKSDLYLTALS